MNSIVFKYANVILNLRKNTMLRRTTAVATTVNILRPQNKEGGTLEIREWVGFFTVPLVPISRSYFSKKTPNRELIQYTWKKGLLRAVIF